MQHTDYTYNLLLLPLVCFGGFSVMLAFVVLLPGVGQFLATVFPFVTADQEYQRRKRTKQG